MMFLAMFLACGGGSETRTSHSSSDKNLPDRILNGLCERNDLSACQRLAKQTTDPTLKYLALDTLCSDGQVESCKALVALGEETEEAITVYQALSKGCMLGEADMCERYIELRSAKLKSGDPLPGHIQRKVDKLAELKAAKAGH